MLDKILSFRFLNLFYILMIFCVFLFSSSVTLYSQESSTMVIRMNGHSYPQEEDLFKRSLQDFLSPNLNTDALETAFDSLTQDLEITINEISIPDSVIINYLVDESGVNDFIINISQDPWYIQAEGFGCEFDIYLTNLEFDLSGTSEFGGGEFKVFLNTPEITAPTIEVVGTGNFFTCPTFAAGLQIALTQQIDTLITALENSFSPKNSEDLFSFLNPFAFLLDRPAETIEAAVKSFPMHMRILTEEYEIVQLILEVDFLLGTTDDSTAFVGVIPDEPDGIHLDYGGFSFLYWVLQQGYRWHNDWDEFQKVDKSFEVMSGNQIPGYRLELRWSDAQIQAYTGSELDPDDITPESIETFISQSMYWDTTAFTDTKQILDKGRQKNLVPFMALGVGHESRVPTVSGGRRIAPASELWPAVDGYVGVSAAEYLYNLKIFAHATVRRFAHDIDIWQIENELNAAGFAAATPDWWRKGDLWLDEEFRNQVWNTLVTAVRTEDPSALITHDLHMLGFMQGLENWIEDMDIVGINFYPNQATALPNLGFAVGEYVWAVRRALKGLNQTKPVWVIETGFPGVEQEDAPDSLLLNEDLFYFSESRQTDYVQDALLSSVEYGARGFFYYSLTTPEDYNSDIFDNRSMRFSGMIRRETDEEKPALQNFASLLNTYLSKTEISESSLNIPESPVLFQNYPNPFNPSTTIKFTLPKSEYVKLTIYNLNGEKIVTFVSNMLNQGYHVYHFDGTNLASGVYYFQLIAGNYNQIRKMILIK